MTIDTLAAAKTALMTLLAPGGTPAISGVDVVYDHERVPGQGAKACYMTLFTAGMTPTDYGIAVRIYQSTEVDAQAAQASLDTIMLAADRVICSTGTFGFGQWDCEFHPELSAVVATMLLTVGREDFSLR